MTNGSFTSLSAPPLVHWRGGEGWGEGGDARAPADTHLTLPRLRRGPLPLRPEGRRGVLLAAPSSALLMTPAGWGRDSGGTRRCGYNRAAVATGSGAGERLQYDRVRPCRG